MSERNRLTRSFVVGAALVAGAALGVRGASAAGTKVPDGDQIKKKVERLYNGEISSNDSAGRENTFVAVEKFLSKDHKSIGMKSPDFWSDAVQEGRFSGKTTIKKLKTVMSEDIEVTSNGKTAKAKMWYRGGGLVSATHPCPLLVSILERGADPKAYLEATWIANDAINKEWVVVAIAMSDEFPADKDAAVLLRPFSEIGGRYNIESNRWYLEGVGAACDAVQASASNAMAARLAGLVLRAPTKPVLTTNSSMYPTLVVRSETSKEGADVFEAYKKIDEKNNEELKLPDVPSVTAMNEQIVAWFGKHAARAMPASYSFTTTITDTEGEQWTGSMWIHSPGKRGQPTKVSVKYMKDSNTVDVQCDNLGEFFLYMNDDLLDLDKEVQVFANGTALLTKPKKFERDLREMFRLADTVGEYGHMFSAVFRGVVTNKIAAPPAPPAAGPDAPPGGNPPPAGGNPPPAGNPPPGGNPPPPK